MEYTSRTSYLSSRITDPALDPRVQKAHDTYYDAVSMLNLYLDTPLADETEADTVTALVAQIEECVRTVSSLLGNQDAKIRDVFAQEAQAMLNRATEALSIYRAANPQGPQGTHIDLVRVADELFSNYAQAANDMKSFLDGPFGDFNFATKFAGGLKGCAHALMEHYLQYDKHTEETEAACKVFMDAVEEWLKSAQVKGGHQPSSAFQLRSAAPTRVGALMDRLAAEALLALDPVGEDLPVLGKSLALPDKHPPVGSKRPLDDVDPNSLDGKSVDFLKNMRRVPWIQWDEKISEMRKGDDGTINSLTAGHFEELLICGIAAICYLMKSESTEQTSIDFTHQFLHLCALTVQRRSDLRKSSKNVLLDLKVPLSVVSAYQSALPDAATNRWQQLGMVGAFGDANPENHPDHNWIQYLNAVRPNDEYIKSLAAD